jgi:hypothetical protein
VDTFFHLTQVRRIRGETGHSDGSAWRSCREVSSTEAAWRSSVSDRGERSTLIPIPATTSSPRNLMIAISLSNSCLSANVPIPGGDEAGTPASSAPSTRISHATTHPACRSVHALARRPRSDARTGGIPGAASSRIYPHGIPQTAQIPVDSGGALGEGPWMGSSRNNVGVPPLHGEAPRHHSGQLPRGDRGLLSHSGNRARSSQNSAASRWATHFPPDGPSRFIGLLGPRRHARPLPDTGEACGTRAKSPWNATPALAPHQGL